MPSSKRIFLAPGSNPDLLHRQAGSLPLVPTGNPYFIHGSVCMLGFPGGSAGKEPACNAGDLDSIPGLGRSPWRRGRLPTSVFWPEEFHGLSRIVHEFAESRTRLSDFDFHFHVYVNPSL